MAQTSKTRVDHYVYILQSKSDGRYYVGHTRNLAKRVARHNQGTTRWTRGRGPWKLVYSEEYATRSNAIVREREIKAKKSKQYIEALIGKP